MTRSTDSSRFFFTQLRDKTSKIVLSRDQLLRLKPTEVIVCRWPSPLPSRYYRNFLPDVPLKHCKHCNKVKPTKVSIIWILLLLHFRRYSTPTTMSFTTCRKISALFVVPAVPHPLDLVLQLFRPILHTRIIPSFMYANDLTILKNIIKATQKLFRCFTISFPRYIKQFHIKTLTRYAHTQRK